VARFALVFLIAWGAAAPLLLTGSIGLFVHAHEAIPDLAGSLRPARLRLAAARA
jgi:hypothetical protein